MPEIDKNEQYAGGPRYLVTYQGDKLTVYDRMHQSNSTYKINPDGTMERDIRFWTTRKSER
jgi:hypothetical protein